MASGHDQAKKEGGRGEKDRVDRGSWIVDRGWGGLDGTDPHPVQPYLRVVVPSIAASTTSADSPWPHTPPTTPSPDARASPRTQQDTCSRESELDAWSHGQEGKQVDKKDTHRCDASQSRGWNATREIEWDA